MLEQEFTHLQVELPLEHELARGVAGAAAHPRVPGAGELHRCAGGQLRVLLLELFVCESSIVEVGKGASYSSFLVNLVQLPLGTKC